MVTTCAAAAAAAEQPAGHQCKTFLEEKYFPFANGYLSFYFQYFVTLQASILLNVSHIVYMHCSGLKTVKRTAPIADFSEPSHKHSNSCFAIF